ncbi:S-layer homology domain-containing protein [Paenibacillus massiliensis]|uniref:S-layer homology domain-containing protein n=1 Tax=Paenibacillus massiliensis TaxID=225917 RepID=UPI00048D5B6D|nr:S-layer homology domain-containing protein [Paenibacillus massiliensis]
MNNVKMTAAQVAAVLLLLAPALQPAAVGASGATISAVSSGASIGAVFTDAADLTEQQRQMISRAMEMGVIQGNTDGTFRPAAELTRQELAVLLVKALELPLPESSRSSFKDVPAGGWSSPYIEAAKSAGWVQGTGGNTFNPKQKVTAQELIAVLVRATGVQGAAEEVDQAAAEGSFPDEWAGGSDWAEPLLRVAYEANLLSDYSGSLSPAAPVNRADAAGMLVSAFFPQQRASLLKDVQEGSAIINGVRYQIGTELQGILNSDNSTVLHNAKVEFHATGRTLDQLLALEIVSGGLPANTGAKEFSGNVTLNGQGASLEGNLTIAGDFLSVVDLKVNGDLTIDPNVQHDFYAESLQVKGQTFVQGGDRDTVVFQQSSLNEVSVTKKDVHVVASGNTTISSMTLESSSAIDIDNGATLTRLVLTDGASAVELNGSVGTVLTTNSEPVKVTGDATIQKLIIDGAGAVDVDTTGTIAVLEVNQTGENVKLGENVKVGQVAANANVSERVVGAASQTTATTTAGSTDTTSSSSNRAPVLKHAIPDLLLTGNGQDYVVNLSDYIHDPDGDTLTYAAVSLRASVARPTVRDGKLYLTSGNGGSSTIRLTVSDPRGKKLTASFNVIVNAPPVPTPIPDQQLRVNEQPVELDVSAYFSDPEHAALKYTIASTDNSIVSAVITGTQLRLTPRQAGQVSITVTADDGQVAADGTTGQASATFDVHVEAAELPDNNPQPEPQPEPQPQPEPENHSPIVQTLMPIVLMPGIPGHDLDVSQVFSDPDGDVLTYSAWSSDPNLAFVQLTGNLLHVQGVAAGSVTIILQADDSRGGVAQAMLPASILPLLPMNQQPVVTNTPSMMNLIVGHPQQELNLSQIFSDPDGDALTYEVSVSDADIAEAVEQAGILGIQGRMPGSASISIIAKDGRGGLVSTQLNLSVLSAASIGSIPEQRLELGAQPWGLDLSPFLSNFDESTLSVTAATYDSSIADVSVNGALLSLIPYNIGATTVTMSVYDGYGRSQSAQFPVLVSLPAVNNRAPQVVASISSQILTPGITNPRNYDVSQLFADEDGDVLQFTVVSSLAQAVRVQVTGNILTLEPGILNGTATITVTADDGKGGTNTYSFEASNAQLVNAGLTLVDVKYGLSYKTIDLNMYFPGESSFKVYKGTADSTFIGPTGLSSTEIKLSADMLYTWVVGADGRAVVFMARQAAQQPVGLYFSQYLDGGDGRQAIELYYNGDGTGERATGYTLEIHRFMKQTQSMNVVAMPLNAPYPNMPFIIIGDIFYDAMDIMNIWYYNEEAVLHRPTDFNLVALVLKKNGVVVDVLGNPAASQSQLLANGGTIVRKSGISYGSSEFSLADEWNVFPKGTYQYFGTHTP